MITFHYKIEWHDSADLGEIIDTDPRGPSTRASQRQAGGAA